MPRPSPIFALLIVASWTGWAVAAEQPPNIVYIMSDELAYYELSHMGNPRIRTPHIDRLAAEGIRFTRALAASPVCAPLRCNLMTGKHAGHASVRVNDGGTPLRAGEPTIATMLKQLGYATGGFGKWGCGGRDSTGVPEQHGFDVFFGYYDQVHAHSFYPPYLIQNSEEVVLEGNRGGRSGETYSHYVIMEKGLEFIREHRQQPFFCYLPITPPHGMYDIPADDPAWQLYEEDAWMKDPAVPQDAKNYAAMVSLVDRNVRQVLDLLAQLELDENTIVFFTGDNGGQDRFRSKQYPRGYFGPNVNPRTGVEFRGGKGNLYEGGLRIPFLVHWPGRIEPGQVSDLLFYQVDVMPTLAELVWHCAPEHVATALSGAKAAEADKTYRRLLPPGVDGMSILPELLGAEAVGRQQGQHKYMYWEYGRQVAVRRGDWKAIRPGSKAAWELYELETDVSETNSVADQHPEMLARLVQYAQQAHEPARPGTFSDRTRHERDRQAKWGSSRRGGGNLRPLNRIEAKDLVPASEMEIVRCSSENEPNQRLAAHAIDGHPGTHWHSRFAGKVEEHPHELVIDLGAEYEIRGFRYLVRQDGGWNGAFADTEFFVSSGPEQFGEPVVKQTFGKVRAAQPADCQGTARGRYILVRVLSEVNGKPWASAAEIGVIGTKVKSQGNQ